MKNKFYKGIIIALYLVALIILFYCISVRLTPNVYLPLNSKLLLLLTLCVIIYINGYLLIKKINYDKKILKINLITYFLIYTVIIFSLTLFDEIFGRRGLVIIKWNRELLKLYSKYSLNLVPFKTIKLFTLGYFNGVVSFKNFAINIIGNLCAFMPYGIFLPMIFKGINKYSKFLLTMVVYVAIIELLQLVTLSGSCDIDDLILNVTGASLIYFLSRIKCVNKVINKVLLYE